MSALLICQPRPVLSWDQAQNTHFKWSLLLALGGGGEVRILFINIKGRIHQLISTHNVLQKITKHCLC